RGSDFAGRSAEFHHHEHEYELFDVRTGASRIRSAYSAVRHEAVLLSGLLTTYQFTFTPIWMNRDRRAALGSKNNALICAPLASNRAVVSRFENCVAFTMLYASPRSSSDRLPSLNKLNRRVTRTSQLLIPGLVRMPGPALPQ